MPTFDAEALIAAYRAGVFPMAESRDDPELFLVDPRRRGVIPLDGLHVPRRLARVIRQDRFTISLDMDFEGVLDACAAPGAGREETWISKPIRRLYLDLHARGVAHSVECRRDGRLVGGLYGVALGGAFFGESMFSRPDLGGADASKTALVHLVARLRAGGFTLLDTQFLTDHLTQFGAVEISRAEYRRRLATALARHGDLYVLDARSSDASGAGARLRAGLGEETFRGAGSLEAGGAPTGAEVLQLISQRS